MNEERGVRGVLSRAQLVTSAFTIVSWSAGRVEITSTISGTKFTSENLDLLRVVHAFARPRTVHEVVRELDAYTPAWTAACIDDLVRCNVLICASSPELPAAHHWDWSSLAFHQRSRQGGFHKTCGHGTSAVAARLSQTVIPLSRVAMEAPRDLADVIEARSSRRIWPDMPIRSETFSRLLWLSARDRGIRLEGTQDEYVSRPYPSGGASWSLEVYPIIAPEAVESTAAGVYRYLPAIHCLEPVTNERAEYLPFLEAAARSAGTATTPPVLLIITSRYAKQSESYGSLAYSLILKEVGCLIQTLYLVGEYLQLASCALGGGTPSGQLARLCNTTEVAEPVVGEFMLGPR